MDSKERDKVTPNVISYYTFESIQARNERQLKRMWVVIIILIAMLFFSNAIWATVLYGSDFESYDYEQGDSGINIIGDENKEVTYNGAASENTQDNPQIGSERQNQTGESADG